MKPSARMRAAATLIFGLAATGSVLLTMGGTSSSALADTTPGCSTTTTTAATTSSSEDDPNGRAIIAEDTKPCETTSTSTSTSTTSTTDCLPASNAQAQTNAPVAQVQTTPCQQTPPPVITGCFVQACFSTATTAASTTTEAPTTTTTQASGSVVLGAQGPTATAPSGGVLASTGTAIAGALALALALLAAGCTLVWKGRRPLGFHGRR